VDLEGTLDRQGIPALLALMETEVHQDLVVIPGHQEPKERVDPLDPLVLRAQRVNLGMQDSKDQQDFLDRLDLLGQLGLKGWLGPWVLLELLDNLGLLVPLDLKELLDFLDHPVQLVSLALVAPLVLKEVRVTMVRQGLVETMVNRVNLGQQVKLEALALLGLVDSLVEGVDQGQEVKLDLLVKQDHRDSLDQLAQVVPRGLVGTQDQQEPVAVLD